MNIVESNFGTGSFSRLSWKLHRHVLNQDDRTFLSRLFGRDRADRVDVSQFRLELQCFKASMTERAAMDAHCDLHPDYELMLHPRKSWFPLFYSIIRIHQPTALIETGCATGFTSSLMLYALKQNERGHLTSIDIPARKGQFEMNWGLPDGLKSGYLVPASLREDGRWSLVLENARDALPRLLQMDGFRELDLFYHDSDHSFGHQMWEYLTVWPHLSTGGLLLSDDIGWSSAFRDFCRHVGRKMAIHKGSANFGAIRK
jgi:predicted O-methyltransferase YrrM